MNRESTEELNQSVPKMFGGLVVLMTILAVGFYAISVFSPSKNDPSDVTSPHQDSSASSIEPLDPAWEPSELNHDDPLDIPGFLPGRDFMPAPIDP